MRIKITRFLLALACLACCLLAIAADTAAPPRVIATEYPDLQSAVNALPDRTGEVYLPAGTYVLTKTLDLTYPPGGYHGGIKLLGAGRMTKIVAKTKGQPAIDLTGANQCIMQDLVIEGSAVPAEAPNVGLLLARNLDGGAAQEHRFTNVGITGYYTVADVYNITSELDRFIGCIFINRAPNAHNFVWSSDNFAGVTSPYRGKIKEKYSNTELRIEGCSFYNWAEPAPAKPIAPNTDANKPAAGAADAPKVTDAARPSNIYLLGYTLDLTVRDCYMNPPIDGYGVYLGMSRWGGPVQDALFESIRIEGSRAKDIFRIEGRAENITIRQCTVHYGEACAINADTATSLVVERNHLWNNRGWKTAIHAENLFDSRISDNFVLFDNWEGKNPQTGPEVVIRGAKCERSYLQVGSRSQVEYANLAGTTIEAVNDGGTRRMYLGEFATGTTFNLTPVNTAQLKGMRLGDIALDDGTNTRSKKPALAVYDGTAWQYMN